LVTVVFAACSRLTNGSVLAVAVGEHIHQAQPAMCSHHPERQRTTLDKLDQMRPAHIQQLGSLDRRQLGLQRRHRHSVPSLQVLHDRHQHLHQLSWHVNCFTVRVHQPGRQLAITVTSKSPLDHRQLPRLDGSGPDLHSARHGKGVVRKRNMCNARGHVGGTTESSNSPGER
jgi:hypothetical protein